MHFESTARGGRPSKKRNLGRPAGGESVNTFLEHIKDITPPPIRSSTTFQYTGNRSVVCYACQCVLQCPVELACGHYTCAKCLVQSVQTSRALDCSVCKCHLPLNPSSARAPSSLTLQLLRDVKVECHRCSGRVKLETIDRHQQSGCSSDVDITIDELLQQQSSSVVTNVEQRVASHVIRRHWAQSGGKPFEVHTGGKVSIHTYKHK